MNTRQITTTSESLEYKTKLIGSTPDDNNILDAKNVVPLKCLSNFWRSSDLPLINYMSRIPRLPPNPVDSLLVQEEVPAVQKTATFKINNAKLYV